MDELKKRGYGIGYWTVTLLAVLVLVVYPLSFGPIYWLGQHGFISKPAENVLGNIYYPLFVVIGDRELFVIPFKWYLQLWVP